MKRRNYSPLTIKNYLNQLKQFLSWLNVPVESASNGEVKGYIDYLLEQQKAPKTINCHLMGIRTFYNYLREEEEIPVADPVRRGYALRLPKPLPRHLRDEHVNDLFGIIKNPRDRAMFTLMLRCGLRVDEVAKLTIEAIDYRRSRIFVYRGKGGKDRVVYISSDAGETLAEYLQVRPTTKNKQIFLVEKGTCKGEPISVRGIQKRIEHYAKKIGFPVSCHHLRHTMATQLLNADAALVSIQDLLGHARIMTTQRYCSVSNVKVQSDYHKAMENIMAKSEMKKAEHMTKH